MKKAVIIVGILIVVAAAAILLIPRTPGRTWNTYEAHAFGFTMPYPSDWRAVSSTDGGGFFSPKILAEAVQSGNDCSRATSALCYSANIQQGLFSVAFAYGNTNDGIFKFDPHDLVSTSTAQNMAIEVYEHETPEMYQYEFKMTHPTGANFIYLFLSSPKDPEAKATLKEMIKNMKFVLSGAVREKLPNGTFGGFVSSTKIIFESPSSTDQNVHEETISDVSGLYLINLPPGQYNIRPSHPGYKEKQPVGSVIVSGKIPQVGNIVIEK
jgi:hypothetical protein